MTEIAPVSESEIWDLINSSEVAMSVHERHTWNLIKIQPTRWSEPDFGTATGGFWAVATFGDKVLWYNEIEDGFNLSLFSNYGVIGEYWCDQLELHHWIRRLSHVFANANSLEFGRFGPPKNT